MTTSTEAPRLAVEPIGVERWRITNQGVVSVRLFETWLPHGRFRGESTRHDRVIGSGESVILDLRVRTSGAPGETVENAFLILRLDGWRVLARLAVRFDSKARPHPEVVMLTSQRSGFSGVED